MIEKLQNHRLDILKKIFLLFQLSYTVEAKLLGAVEFPPLKRPLESYVQSKNSFFGYFDQKEFAGIIEIEYNNHCTNIHSLVVKPDLFRTGIARKMLEFIFNKYDSQHVIVETGHKNIPASELYKRMGFIEIKQWDTDFGIRKVQFEKRIK